MRRAPERNSLKRQRMVQEQLVARGIKDERVLAAFNDVPRHIFVPEAFQDRAYDDRPLPIGEGQTISQPYMVAIMTEKLAVEETSKVLEIGTGSGYQTAILAKLADKVYSVERIMPLTVAARKALESIRIHNVVIKVSDGTVGWDENAPFDRIIVTAASPDVPNSLMNELTVGGKLVIPVGTREIQRLVVVTRVDEINFDTQDVCGCTFVPLIGKYGWEA